MAWKIIERKIGRAGGEKQRFARQREWNHKYGEDSWAIGYVIAIEFIRQEDAVFEIYNPSYAMHLDEHP